MVFLHQKTVRQKGMTIIEIIIAVFLMFVMFIVFLAGLNTVKLLKENNYADTAYHVANQEMETIRGLSFASLTNVSNAAISDPRLTQIPSGSGSYTIADSGTMTGIKEITVTVSWNDGKAKSVTVQTLAGNGGINP